MREKGTAAEHRSLLGRASASNLLDRDVANGIGMSAGGRKLGTILGVFVPCLVQIFGLTIFVRIPFIVGQAGLLLTLALYTLAGVVSSLTLCSLCALVTNGDISGGGTYFVISRSLGPEFGGSVGVVFCLANLVSVTAYCSVVLTQLHDGGFFGLLDEKLDEYLSYFLLLLACTVTTMSGAQVVARLSVPIVGLVLLALWLAMFSLLFRAPHPVDANSVRDWTATAFTGPSVATLSNNSATAFRPDRDGDEVSVASIFGIVFPSCTGIMSGVNMSDDLHNPSRSIPRGTAAGFGFAFLHIIGLCVILATTCERDALITHTDTLLADLCWIRLPVQLGLFAAVSSSAVSSLAASARLLQAMAADQILPNLICTALSTQGGCKAGRALEGEPHRATLACAFVVALLNAVPVYWDGLDSVLGLTSMFFLQSYAITNLACLALRMAATPNFRPTFGHFSKRSAAIGLSGCLGCMYMIDAQLAALSWVATVGLWILIHLSTPAQNWGEVTQALLYHQTRELLLRLDSSRRHVRNWRPQILLLLAQPTPGSTGSNNSGGSIARCLNQMKKSGLLLLAHIVPMQRGSLGRDESWATAARICQRRQRELFDLVEEGDLKAFPSASVAHSILSGIQSLVSGGAGLGHLAPNIVCFGYPGIAQDKVFGSQRSSRPTSLSRLPEISGRDSSDGDKLTPEQYIEALQICVFFGKSLLVARGFGAGASGSTLKGPDMNVSANPMAMFSESTAAHPEYLTGSGPRFVDVWAWDEPQSDNNDFGVQTREAQHDDTDFRLHRWTGSSTLSLTLQLAWLHVEAGTRRGESGWRLRLLTYVEWPHEVAAAERQLRATLDLARVTGDTVVICVQSLSLPQYQRHEADLQANRSSPPRGFSTSLAQGPTPPYTTRRAPSSPVPYGDRVPDSEIDAPRSVFESLGRIELAALRNSVVHAGGSGKYCTALLLLPLPALPPTSPAGTSNGHVSHDVPALEWLEESNALCDGLGPTLMAYNPGTPVVSVRI